MRTIIQLWFVFSFKVKNIKGLGFMGGEVLKTTVPRNPGILQKKNPTTILTQLE